MIFQKDCKTKDDNDQRRKHCRRNNSAYFIKYTYTHIKHVSLSRIFADGNLIQNIRQDTKFTPLCVVATVVGVM